MRVGGGGKNSHHRRNFHALKARVTRGVRGYAPQEFLKSGPLRVHNFSSTLEQKIIVFKKNTDIIKF